MEKHSNGFIIGTTAAVPSWLLTSVSTHICFCKPSSCRACPGTPRADRGRAAHGGAAWRRGGGRTDRTGGRCVGSPRIRTTIPHPPDDRRKPSWACLGKHEQTNKFQCKPMEGQNKRLIRKTRDAHPSWLMASVLTLIFRRKHFSCKACPGFKSSPLVFTTGDVYVLISI